MIGIEIPASTYAVFTETGAFPKSLVDTWQAIWKSNVKRLYKTDFEVYPPYFNPNDSPEVKIYIPTDK